MQNITIVNENAPLVEYSINVEEVKTAVSAYVDKYRDFVVTDDTIPDAKKARADLNKQLKEINDRLITVKKKHNEPIALLAEQVKSINAIIQEPLLVIDQSIRNYEVRQKNEKQALISEKIKAFNTQYDVEIPESMIIKDEWLNQTYTKKKITNEITALFERVKGDIDVINNFPEDEIIPLKLLYLRCLDMSRVMQEKIALDKAKKEKADREAKEAEAQALRDAELAKQEAEELMQVNNAGATGYQSENMVIHNYSHDEVVEEFCDAEPEEDYNETIAKVLSRDDDEDEIPEAPSVEQQARFIPENEIPAQEAPKTEIVKFWVEVTPAQKLLMREFISQNGIKCGAIKD